MARRLRSAKGRNLWPEAALLNRGRGWLGVTLGGCALPDPVWGSSFVHAPGSLLPRRPDERRGADDAGAMPRRAVRAAVLLKLAGRFMKDIDRLTNRLEEKGLRRARWSSLIRYHRTDTLAYAAQAIEWTGAALLSTDDAAFSASIHVIQSVGASETRWPNHHNHNEGIWNFQGPLEGPPLHLGGWRHDLWLLVEIRGMDERPRWRLPGSGLGRHSARRPGEGDRAVSGQRGPPRTPDTSTASRRLRL